MPAPMKHRFIAAFLIFVLSFALLIPAAAIGQTTGTRKVTIYYWEFNRDEDGDEMIPFTRYVDAKAPLRPTIEALLADPLESENRNKYASVRYDNDLKLEKVEVRGRTARIDFVREVSGDTNPGDLATLRFEDTVIRTAKQFPNIRKVIVCVNGINEFGIGMVEDRPKPCPVKW